MKGGSGVAILMYKSASCTEVKGRTHSYMLNFSHWF